METIQVLMNRKSVRVFEDKEITPEIKDIILAAAMRAPTGGNCMPYSIIDVTDQSIKGKLAETCDHQPFIAQAKMVLIFCADYHRWYRKFKMAGCEDIPAPELSNMVLATEDAVIAAHTACIAAESLGIGSCYRPAMLVKLRDSQRAFKPAPAGRAALHAGLRLSHSAAKGRKTDNSFCKELHRV